MSGDAGPSTYFHGMAPSPAYTPGSALPSAPPMPPPSVTSYLLPQGPSQGNKRPRDAPRRGGGRGRGRGGRGGLAFDRTVAGPATGLRRTTRQSTQAQKFGDPSGRKVKLRLGGTLKGKARAGYMLETPFGWYDRGLDEDKEEPSVYEEQFILRVNDEILRGDPDKGVKGLREAVLSRKAVEGVSIKWKDERRATFAQGDKLYAAKMVDLPCIIESQKIMDNKRLFKVADISQMLVVGERILSEEQLDQRPKPTQEELTWPDGLTAAMRNVRQERWRHRIDLGSDATVVDAVERLMKLDAMAIQSRSHFVSAASLQTRPSVDPQQQPATPQDDFSQGITAPSPAASTPAGSHGRDRRASTSGRESYVGDEDMEADYGGREATADQEQDIVKRFNERMQRDAEGQGEGRGDVHDDLFGESDDDEEEDEDVDEVSDAEEDEAGGLDKEDQELIKQQNKLAGEISDLEDAVKRKRVEVQGKQNRTLRERANIQLQKMIKELDSKRAEHDQVVAQRSSRQDKPTTPDANAPASATAADAGGTPAADKADDDQVDDEEDSLFGESDHEEDDVPAVADDDDDAEGEEDTDAMASAVALGAANAMSQVQVAPDEAKPGASPVVSAPSDVPMASPPDEPSTSNSAVDTTAPAAAVPPSAEAQAAPMARSTSQVEPNAPFDYDFSEPSDSDDDD